MSSTTGKFVFWWIAANTLAWALWAGTLFWFEGRWTWIAGAAIAGAAQWLVLRRGLGVPPTWIAGSCLALLTVFGADSVCSGNWCLYGSIAVGATLAGVVQSWILWRRVAWPALWLPATIASSTLGWRAGFAVGFWVFDRASGFAACCAGGAALGAVIGVVSAPVLAWMLRHPKQRQSTEGKG